jgi:hypothetical protein
MKLLIMQFSPTSCHFISLRSKYSPQQPVLKDPQSKYNLVTNTEHKFTLEQLTLKGLILSFHLCRGLPDGLVILSIPMCATYSTYSSSTYISWFW